MFEKEYKRANDRIHPRKDLLKEMEAKWADETVRLAEEKEKTVAFPTWAKYVSAAAGILLCIGLGMGSVMLFARRGNVQNKAVFAEAPRMDAIAAAEEEEAKIITEAAETAQADAEDTAAAGTVPMTMFSASDYEPPKGMHLAEDEAEVEDAIRYGHTDWGEAQAEEVMDAEVPVPQAKAAARSVDSQYPNGEILRRDDLLAVFMPTTEQIQVVQYANHKLTKIFALGLRENGAQVKRVFWTSNEFLAIREKNGDTELVHFDVSSWKTPRHLKNLSQSGTFLWAGEMDGRICILSLYQPTDEEPWPWINGSRMDFSDILLDSSRPADTYTVLTVYDSLQADGFLEQTALLTHVSGAVAGEDGILLWTETEDPMMYALFCGEEGLILEKEDTVPGIIRHAATAKEGGYKLLLQNGDSAVFMKLSRDLETTASFTAEGTGAIRWGQIYDDGTVFLTADSLHMLTEAGDKSLEVSGDVFKRLTENRFLVVSGTGRMQLAEADEEGLKALGSVDVKDSLELLLQDISLIDFDPDTGRLVFTAGQKAYQYLINEKGNMTLRGSPLLFADHKDKDQREIRCLLTNDRALVFYKSGIHICNMTLARQTSCRY